MELIKEFTESSAYTFLNDKTDDEIEKMIDNYGCDHELIQDLLNKQYPENKYFVLVDFVLVDYVDENNGSFNIRIWKKD